MQETEEPSGEAEGTDPAKENCAQLVETPGPTEAEPQPSEVLDALADEADGGVHPLETLEPLEPEMTVKEPVTEPLDLVPSQISIPAAQPEPQAVSGHAVSGETSRSPVSPAAVCTQTLDEGFRAGLRLLHTEELRHLCTERGLIATGTKRELLNVLLAHFACAPQPTPTQDASSPSPHHHRHHGHHEHQAVPAVPAESTAAPPTKPTKPPTKAPSPLPPHPPAQARVDLEPPPAKAPRKAQALQAQPRREEPEPSKSGTKVSDMQGAQPALVEEVEQLRQLRPLKPVQRVTQTSLLRRQRGPGPTAAPNFSALWQTMCPSKQSEIPEKQGEGTPRHTHAHMRERERERADLSSEASLAPLCLLLLQALVSQCGLLACRTSAPGARGPRDPRGRGHKQWVPAMPRPLQVLW